ncbi:MAG: type II toxin-antitoxin system RelE/ParE family toxin [Clostridiales bacterium]|nr:type II toxin-antitoxin system RelE/ParE family toxin [Clostridiales bacterium]
MELYNVAVSATARKDIRDAVSYINSELSAPRAAQEMEAALKAGITGLAFAPKRYAIVSDDRMVCRGYRALPIKNYLVFYKVDEPARTVQVVRVLFKRREWGALL